MLNQIIVKVTSPVFIFQPSPYILSFINYVTSNVLKKLKNYLQYYYYPIEFTIKIKTQPQKLNHLLQHFKSNQIIITKTKMSQYQTPALFSNTAVNNFAQEATILSMDLNVNVVAATENHFMDEEESHSMINESALDKFIKQESPALAELELANVNTDISATYQSIDSEVVDAFFSSSTETTPMFEFEQLETSNKQWSSLFDNEIPVTSEDVNTANELIESIDESQEESKINVSIVNPNASFLPTPVIEDSMIGSKQHFKSGAVEKKSNKVDRLGVIAYNRKQRALPLTPVIATSEDPVAVKRARNTEAARRSRARKVERMSQLEDRVEELLLHNSKLEKEVLRLRSILGAQS